MLTCDSYRIRIYLAGDYDVALEACREWADNGGCVTVSKCEYVYTGGQESGVVVGMINYPPREKTPDLLKAQALELANHLKDRLHQRSFTIEFPDETITVGREKIT